MPAPTHGPTPGPKPEPRVEPPRADDGRNLDPGRALELGEAAQIEVESPEAAWPVAPEAHPAPATAPSETYYELPVVKPAPWKSPVPAYFYAGGVAGAAASLAAAVQLAGRDPVLERRLHWIAALGDAIGGALLIEDLGRPARFHHMLRVVRPTSPMNVGTWVLTAAGATSGLALLGALRGRPARAATIAGGVVGTLLSTYTGVLIGNTAIPVWSATRDRLPVWFAAASGAGLASLLELAGARSPVVRRYSAVAKAAELAGAHAVRRAAEAAGVARPLHEGRSGRMWRGATWLGAASLAATLWPGGGLRRTAGLLGTAAAVLARFAIVEAGRASAADPRATFEPQRR